MDWRAETLKDVEADDPSQIFLVDHAWTFRTDQARQQLTQVPGLASRMAGLMDIEEDEDQEALVEAVLTRMWRYCQTYSIGNAESVEDRQPHWYIMDEFGCRIPHSDSPSYRTVPFIYAGDGLGYSLLFSVTQEANEAGTEVTRDYVEGEARGQGKVKARLRQVHGKVMAMSKPVQDKVSKFMAR